MTKIYRIPTGQVEGNGSNDTNTGEIRPYGEIAVYVGDNNKLELLMFDGVRTHVRSKVLNKGTFYGGDADSSDGLNRDTIKLVPGEELRRNGSDQYLVIDPTYGEPGHIHIRAGGTIDQSTADLFLGGELNNVRISDLGNYVQISADAGGEGATKQWRFDSVGGLTLPAGAEIIGQGGITLWGQGVMSSTAYVSLPSNEDASSTYLTVGNYSSTGVLIQAGTTNPPKNFRFKGSGDLELPGSGKFIDTPTVAEVGTIITVPLNAAGDTEDYVGGASVLEIPKNADTNQVQAGWIITFPNDVQRTVSGVIDGGSYWTVQYNEANPGLGSSTYPLFIQSADYAQGSVGTLTVSKAGNITIAGNYNVSIIADYTDTNRVWVFDGSDGSLRFPNDAVLDPSDSNIEFRLMNNFNVEAAGVVNIVTAAAGTAKSWAFEENGSLTFPDTSVQTTAFTGNHPTVDAKFDTVESNILGKVTIGNTLYNIVTISLDTPFTNPLIVVDQPLGPEFPDGQQIEITGVTLPAEVNGVWYAGFQGTSTFRIFDDIEQTQSPDASGWAGYTGGGIVKNLDVHNDLTLTVNGSEWSFDEFANLTLPATFEGYGDIRDPSGVSQLANRVEGSWTLPTGNIGVGFTVPTQGTYVMWVRGNIPNGIIVWNATATVTNTNVPVVGQQFAWVYTGGGTPIDFVSIPDQFVGTAGTIVRSNPGGITNANQFNFTIANLSGSSQTVAWGYVKI